MIKTYKLTFWILGLLLFAGNLQAQPNIPVDERARELVSKAKKDYRTEKYLDAAMTFELAAQRPHNRLTTFSLYMTGLSYYKLKEHAKAEAAFAKLMTEYPTSKYTQETKFHRALILMESDRTVDREKGLDQMFVMFDQIQDQRFKKDIESTIRHFLFNVYDQVFLNLYYLFVKEQHKAMIMEATCSQLDKQGDGFMVLDRIKFHQEKGGMMTSYLVALKEKYESGSVMNPGKLNLVIFLSFHLETMDTATVVPNVSKRALEYFEGMKMALDSNAGTIAKQVRVKIFDTRGDTAVVRKQLETLHEFNPNIIIGDIRTSLARMISNWAERHKVVHIIPRNPLNDLIKGKRYTFLAHPSLHTHGKELARHLVKREGMRRFLVFNDNTYFSKRFTASFKGAIDSFPEVTLVEKVIPQDYEQIKDLLLPYIRSLKSQKYDAVYVPLSSEEAAGLIISQLNYNKIETKVVGGPDWEMFQVIDPELKSSYGLEYSTFYHEDNDSMAYDEIKSRCLRLLHYQPSQYTIQGFDIMSWLLHLSQNMNPFNSPLDMIHKSPVYRGIHQDFYFGEFQDNQKINVVRFHNGRIDKVNRDNQEPGLIPDRLPNDTGGG